MEQVKYEAKKHCCQNSLVKTMAQMHLLDTSEDDSLIREELLQIKREVNQWMDQFIEKVAPEETLKETIL